MNTINLLNYKVSEIEITYRNKVNPSDLLKISNSNDCFLLLLDLWSNKMEYIEEFYILLLNKANKVLGVSKISEGGLSGTVVDPKRIFQVALKSNATSIILAHNHPSGNIKPSEADQKITQKCRDAGSLLDIVVLDHIILTAEQYYSFADEGQI
jgi:DNA repair protein RadC